MKKNILSKLLTILGLLLLLFVAINMNACSKKKDSAPVNPYMYGYQSMGGGHLGNGIGYSADGMILQLTFSGMNNGTAGATGMLTVTRPPSMACSVPMGSYGLQTVRPGYYSNGDFYPQGFTLMASNGMQIYVEGFLNMTQDQNGFRKMFATANIPGCPTTFN